MQERETCRAVAWMGERLAEFLGGPGRRGWRRLRGGGEGHDINICTVEKK
jgi:hypothetical protein